MSEEEKQIYDRIYAEVNDEFYDRFKNCKDNMEYLTVLDDWNSEVSRRILEYTARLRAHQRDPT
jgi:hypothetical protein